MKTERTTKTLKAMVLAAGLLATAYTARCDVPVANNPGHWYAGATNQNLGQLDEYTNGGDFTAASGYVYWLTYTNSAQTGYLVPGGSTSYYFGSNPTYTALGNGTTASDAGSTSTIAAANGALLAMQIVSLAGPAGGHYFFWDLNPYISTHPINQSAPTFTIAVGDTPTNDVFLVSDPSNGAGTPGGDPYGHMHGRRYAVDTPGTYTLGLQVIDVSTNGTGGGPIQTPSQVYYTTFQAGQGISAITLASVRTSYLLGGNSVSGGAGTPGGPPVNGTGAYITFPSIATIANSSGKITNAVYTLLESTNLSDTNSFVPIGTNYLVSVVVGTNSYQITSNSVYGTNVVGNGYFKTFADTNANAANEFYRISVTPQGN